MAPPPARAWPGYPMIWRWHFYAGLFCIPFVLWLAITGAIYVWRPQVEALIDRPLAHLAFDGPRATAADQAAAAVRAVPGSVFHRYQLPDARDAAVQVVVGQGQRETRVYVHPQSLAILKTVEEDDRLMRIVFRLHGELLIGTVGSYIVELAASWAIVMILSGLLLWWPRGGGIAGVLYPRLRAGGRRFWRDIHAVTGFWVSLLALFLLLSGLPWAKSWGSYLKTIRSVAEGSVVGQDWSSGRSAELKQRAAADTAMRAMAGEHAGHDMAMNGAPDGATAATDEAPLDRIIATVAPLGLAAPVLIAPPTTAGAPWTAKSDAADRPLRTSLDLDANTGQILSRSDFAQKRLVDRLVGYGIAIHEGQLFGLANQLLNLATALGLVLLSASSVVLWLRRRPATGAGLGAPPALARRPASLVFIGMLVALGALLPLFGISVLVVLIVERAVCAFLPETGRWLGLRSTGVRR